METREDAIRQKYEARIRRVFDRLIAALEENKKLTTEQLNRAQELVDGLADEYQHSENLGPSLYKLYLSQSLIYLFRDDIDLAEKFLGDAKKYSVNSSTRQVEEALRILEGIDGGASLNSEAAQKISSTNTILSVKTDAINNILKGLILIALSLGITIVSYRLTDNGDKFLIFWGLGIWGAIILAKGVYSYVNPASGPDQESRSINAKGKAWAAVIGSLILTLILSFALIKLFAPALANQIEAGGDKVALYQKNFTEACIQTGGDDTRCGCVARYLTDHNDMERLEQLEHEATNSNDSPAELTTAIANC